MGDGCSTLDESEGQTEISQTSEERREIMERSIFGDALSEDGSCSQLSNSTVSSTDIELPVNATDEILLEKMKIQFQAAAYLTEHKTSVMKAKLVKSDDREYEEVKKQAEKQINELEMEVKALKKIIALPEKPLLDICRKVMNKEPNSSENSLEKHTTIVRNLEKMKDTRPPRLLKMESKTAIRNIQNSVNAMVAVPGSTKLEAMATRKRIKSLQELQSRLHKLMDSLEFKELDNELPFSTARSNSSDKKAQIESDRKLAWELMNKSFDEDPTPESKKKSRKSLGSAANEASNDVLEVPTDPRKKLRKRKLENKQEDIQKKVMKSLSKKSVKSEKVELPSESSTETNSAQNAKTGQAIKTDNDDNQPTVINQSEEDAALANVDMEPGPSGLNSKSISKMFGNK